MTFLDTWKDSLRIFWPANFKLFLLVTLNALVKTFKTVFTKLWFLFVAVIAVDLIKTSITNLLFSLGALTIILGLILASRPSVLKKDIYYFIGYWRHVLLFILVNLIFVMFADFVDVSFFFLERLIWPYICFAFLFFVDGKPSLINAAKAIGRSLKMIWYNLSFVLISAVIFIVVFEIGSLLLDNQIMQLGFVIFGLFFVVFQICYFTNYYVKKIHDNFDLYWGKQ